MPRRITRPPRQDTPEDRQQWNEDVERAINLLADSSHSHGNPTLNLTNISGTTASNSAGLTLSLSAGVGGGGGVAIAGGTQTGTSGTVVFSNSNGITFGMTNSSIITAAHNALTTAMASNRGSDFVQATAAFAGTNASGTIASGGLSVSVGNYITTAMLSNRGSDFVQATAAFAGTSASGTIASGGISVSVGPYITTGALSNHSHGVSFTSGSVAFQTLSFTNSNGISFNSGTQGIFGSHNAITTGRASTDAIGLNTAQTNVTWTVNSSGLSFNAGGYAGTTSGFAGANISGSMTHNSVGLNLSLSVAAPGGGGSINFSAGTTSNNISNVVLSNSNGVSFGLNGSTITASVNAGGAGPVQSAYFWPDDEIGASSGWQVSGSTKHIQPINIPYALSVSFIRFPLSLSCIGQMASIATAANQTIGVTLSSTFQLAFYTQGVGASSRSLQYYATASASWVQQARISAGANGSQWSSGHTISYPVTGGTSEFTSSAQTTLTNRTINTTQLSDFTALQYLDLPLATSFAAGAYWMAYNSSTSAATSVSTQISTVRILASNVVVTQPAQSINVMGSASNSSNLYRIGLGIWSTNSIGTTTSSIGLANISRSASNPIMGFEMIRQA